MTNVNVSTVLGAAIDAVRPAADAKRITIAVRHGDGDALVAGDAARLQQVIWNLLSNAVKFTPSGGSVTVRLSTEGERAVIEVADTGPGMSESDLDALFVRFFRTEAAKKSAVPGTGLGLSIVKAIVEAHGGEIDVDTAEGVGTTFRVFLPLAAVAAAA